MHVLVIPPGVFLTKENPVNGIFQYEQAISLMDAGYKVSIFSVGFLSSKYFFGNYCYKSYEKINGLDVYRRYEKLFIPYRFRRTEKLIEKLYKLADSFFCDYVEKHGKPDIIHAHNVLFSGFLANFIKIKYSIPFVITEHSSAFLRNLLPRRLDKLIGSIYKSADNISCVSQSFKSVLDERYQSNFEILPNILGKCFLDDNYKFCENDEFVFINVAMLNSNKNHKLIIKAFASKFLGKNVKLKIIGDGYLLNELIDFSKKHKVADQVEFLGRRNSQYIKNELLNSNCFVFSSNYETFGVSLIEALSCGLPLISTKNGGGEDIVNDANGLLVSVGDVGEMASAMEEIYLNFHGYNRENLRNQAICQYGRVAFLKKINCFYKI